jgi:hypothetical protein
VPVAIIAALVGAAGVVAGVVLAESLRRRHDESSRRNGLAWIVVSMAARLITDLSFDEVDSNSWAPDFLALTDRVAQLQFACSSAKSQRCRDAVDALPALLTQLNAAEMIRRDGRQVTAKDRRAVRANLHKISAVNKSFVPNPSNISMRAGSDYLAAEGLGAPWPPPPEADR